MNTATLENFPKCITCGASGEPVYRNLKDRFSGKGEFTLKKCPSCSLFWLDPRLSSDEHMRHHVGYFEGEVNEEPNRRLLAGLRDNLRESIICGYYGYKSIHKKHKLCRWAKFLVKIVLLRSRAIYGLGGLFPFHKEDSQALLIDIGCGEGEYLKMMQQLGWKVLGIEPNAAAATSAEKKGLSIFKGTFQEAKLSDSSADMISMNHVLEHLPDPMGAVKDIFRVLKPQGSLVVHTPNASSLGHKIFKNNWYGLDAPRHMFIFSPKSINLLFREAPFRKIQIKTLTSHSKTIYDNSVLMSKCGRAGNRGIKPQQWRSCFAFLETVMCSLGRDYGEEIEVVAIK